MPRHGQAHGIAEQLKTDLDGELAKLAALDRLQLRAEVTELESAKIRASMRELFDRAKLTIQALRLQADADVAERSPRRRALTAAYESCESPADFRALFETVQGSELVTIAEIQVQQGRTSAEIFLRNAAAAAGEEIAGPVTSILERDNPELTESISDALLTGHALARATAHYAFAIGDDASFQAVSAAAFEGAQVTIDNEPRRFTQGQVLALAERSGYATLPDGPPAPAESDAA
jgi:hypothetical protein